MNKEKLTEQLQRQEDLRLKVYKCPAGKWTIGVGRNLEDRGISREEAEYLLNNDIEMYTLQVIQNVPFFRELGSARQNVLINMAFNMGTRGLLGFKKFLKYLEQGDFEKASVEMLDSKWAVQVGIRAKELSHQIKTGEFA